MRLVFRALLLALGCAVMVATSPPPFTEFPPVSLLAGGAQTFDITAQRASDGEPVPPRLSMRVWRNGYGTGPARLVGIVSSEPPPYEVYTRLDPRASFTVGQTVEGGGTVAFVHEVSEAGSGDPEAQALHFPEPRSLFLTLYSPDSNLDVRLDFATSEMEAECGCELNTYVDYVHEYTPSTPDAGADAGTAGHDGG